MMRVQNPKDPPSRTTATAPDRTPRRYAFPKALRLLRGAEFRAVFDEGLKTVSRSFVLFGLEGRCPDSRLGMAVSRKFGNAVRRNRARRLIREAFRIHRHEWPPGIDWVIIPRPNGFPDSMEGVASQLGQAMWANQKHRTRLRTRAEAEKTS